MTPSPRGTNQLDHEMAKDCIWKKAAAVFAIHNYYCMYNMEVLVSTKAEACEEKGDGSRSTT